LRRVLIALFVTIASVAGAAQLWQARTLPLPVLATLPTFQLTDEHEHAFSRDDLTGKVTVVDFIFTSCSTACPLLSAEMAKLQTELATRGLADRVQLASISVDPARDTVEKLRAFAATFGAKPNQWRFLRGDEAAVQAVVVGGMKQVMEKERASGAVDDFTILHGTRFVLVDEHAQIRGYYDANDPQSMGKLRAAITALAAHRVRVEDDAS
jgi:protein SCO1/2